MRTNMALKALLLYNQMKKMKDSFYYLNQSSVSKHKLNFVLVHPLLIRADFQAVTLKTRRWRPCELNKFD